MEEQIEEMLENTYENIILEVEYKDIREYQIKIRLDTLEKYIETKLIYKWNYHWTTNENLKYIKDIIDREILYLFHRQVNNNE